MSKPWMISRRTLLRSAGVALGLPVLEAMAPSIARAQAAGTAPKRLVYFYVPCGIHMPNWTPAETGAAYNLKPILAPLAPLKSDVLVLSGLANMPARPDGAGDHASGTGAFLTCAHPFKTNGAGIMNGVSVDQVAAAAIGSQTRFPSLQLGSDGGGSTGDCDSGYSCAYARNISWASETQPLPKETNPRAVFDRLFGGTDPRATLEQQRKRKLFKQSILDFVKEDASTLKTKLGRTDQRKMDEYLTAIRELETRLQLENSGPVCAADPPTDSSAFPDKVRNMIDVMVLAMQCDFTRVITFMMGNAGDNRAFPFIGVPEQHHDLSHHQGIQANYDKLTLISTWEVEQYASLLTKMKAITEGTGTMLDSSLVFFSSEITDGNAHNHDDMPVLLGGKGGGAVSSGRHVRYSGDPPLANLYLAMLHSVGANAASFGNSTGVLPNL